MISVLSELVICRSENDCFPVPPSILSSIFDTEEKRSNYLFRAKKGLVDSKPPFNRRGGYLFRTKKDIRNRGGYLFRTRKSPTSNILFRT